MPKMSFIQDAGRFGIGWRLWMVLLQLANLIAPLFFLGRVEAQLTLGAYILAAAIIVPLHRRLGWVRLLGIGHFQWFALLPWLVMRYLTTSPTGAFGVWLAAVILINATSLVIDVVDVARYVAGERKPVVAAERRLRVGEKEPNLRP
jgi:hypothetical protein